MKPITTKTCLLAEKVVKRLLVNALKRANGKPIHVDDPDYSEAFGVLRGIVIAVHGKSSAFQPLRLGDGCGPATHTDFKVWLDELIDEVKVAL